MDTDTNLRTEGILQESKIRETLQNAQDYLLLSFINEMILVKRTTIMTYIDKRRSSMSANDTTLYPSNNI